MSKQIRHESCETCVRQIDIINVNQFTHQYNSDRGIVTTKFKIEYKYMTTK